MTQPLQHLTAKLLTYAGTLPLVIAAAELVVGRIPSSDVVWMASTYSAIIISFLAGIHWACYLIKNNATACLAIWHHHIQHH
jgi:hypothetical protein